jgi:hypothetical protein
MLASMRLVGVGSGVGVCGIVVVFVVLRQDLVQPAPGLLEQLFGGADLLGRACVRDLHDAAGQPGGLGEQPGRLPRLLLGPRLPRAARHLGVLLDVGAPGIGQAERAPAVRLLTHDQALVGKLRQRRIDRARAGPPGAAAPFPDVRHDLVAGAGALPQQRQDRGPHIAAASLCWAGGSGGAGAPGRAGETRPSPPAAPLRAGTAAPGPAALGVGGCLSPGAALAPAAACEYQGLGPPQMANQAARAAQHLGQAGIDVPGPPPWSRHPAPPVQLVSIRSRYIDSVRRDRSNDKI